MIFPFRPFYARVPAHLCHYQQTLWFSDTQECVFVEQELINQSIYVQALEISITFY